MTPADRVGEERGGGERTPPQIVAAADRPAEALAAFVVQELEHWGFAVQSLAADGVVKVVAESCEFVLVVAE